jgi:surface antigen
VRAFLVVILAAAAAASPPAMALNWVPLMKNTPFERFDEDDLQMFLQNARKALDTASDNQTVSWRNLDTKHGGDFTILKTFQKDGRDCKQVRVRTDADSRKGNSVVSACKVGAKWKLLGAPVKQK